MWLRDKQVPYDSSAVKYTLLDESESQTNGFSVEDLFPASDQTRSPFDFIDVSFRSTFTVFSLFNLHIGSID